MIKLSQFRCTIHALKFFCGVRGGLFVLIMSDFKHTKEVAQKGTSLVTLTPCELSAQEAAAVSDKKKEYIQKDLYAGCALISVSAIQSVPSLAFNLSSVTLQVLDLFFSPPFSFPLAYSAQPSDSMTNLCLKVTITKG